MNRPFIHLRTLSSYSLSESTIKIENLIKLAKNYNMPAIALTDNNNMFGALEFSLECQKNGIQPIIGTSINILDFSNSNFNSQITFLVKNQEGYENLLYLSSLSHTYNDNKIGVSLKKILEYSNGLISYIGGEFNPLIYLNKNKKNKEKDNLIQTLKESFDDNFYFELQRIKNLQIDDYENEFISIAEKFSIPLIASNNIKYISKDDYNAHDVLLCIGNSKQISQQDRLKSNPNIYFKNNEEMYEIFKDINNILDNNFNVAIKCQFYPSESKPRLPKFPTKLKTNEDDQLFLSTKNGLNQRLNNLKLNSNSPSNSKIYFERLEYELKIIIKMGFSGYFLIVADFVQWAKKNKIPVGPGRGSGAGSLVAWALQITDLDPLKYGLLFERFLNPERVSMPDFDIDFCQNQRDKVKEYVDSKYGRERVALIITFGTLASRAVIRDVGRVYGVPYSEVDRFAKLIPYNPSNPLSLRDSIKSDKNIQEYIRNDERIKNIVDTSFILEGLHRHASTHAAGVVIGDKNLVKSIPLYKDPDTSFNATQFSMKYVEKAGLIKFDFLGLTTLSIIDETIKHIQVYNKNFSLSNIPTDDKKTFKNLSKGNATGVFQLESSGMSNVLKQLQPDRLEEIIAVVALFRPGPMDNIPSYCNRKHGKEEIDYIHPILESILKETYGIIVYQEQVMQIAQALSGYTLGEADLLRRAMGKKIQKEMDAQKTRFIEGAKKNNISYNQAAFIFDLVNKFAGYGFNKCHAAGYALIAYQTAYLKTHFPVEFMTASLNYALDRTDRIIYLKNELNTLDISLLKPDINFSDSKFKIEVQQDGKKSIRFALSAIKGVGLNSMINLVLERESNGKYNDIIDFFSRNKNDVINKRQLEKLIQSGSLDSLYENRSILFNNVEKIVKIFASNINSNLENQTSLFKTEKINFNDKKIFNHQILSWNINEKLNYELNVVGFYFSDHPLSNYPDLFFKKINAMDYSDIIKNREIYSSILVGSILDIKERSNKDGKKYAFVTISNKTSQFEITIFNDIINKYKELIYEGNLIIANVEVLRNNDNIRIIAKKIQNVKDIFEKTKFKLNLFISKTEDHKVLQEITKSSENNQNSLYVYLEKNGDLISFDFTKKYIISDYSKLDKLNQTQKLNYSIEIQ
ncbi:MAG: DNA polymerase III subunit alpha [Alphaproteobacteria bacterium MarineAlpha5_Bin9]|nr:MAG: DNA polymerase III subunit alpha [Alphaproteobacteria bacterium MarineAlpha5_Bin9]